MNDPESNDPFSSFNQKIIELVTLSKTLDAGFSDVLLVIAADFTLGATVGAH
jgi:hypothetical protein